METHTPPTRRRLKRGQELEIEIEKFADRGKSLARLDGYVVFVPGAVPGDRVRVRVTKGKKNFAEAIVIDLLQPSPLRTDPRCFYFETCGGCKWQHVDYAAQLEAKRQSVDEAFRHNGGLDGFEVRPTLGAENVYFYRNKMEFSFSTKRWLTPKEIATGEDFDTDFALGLHVPGNFYKVIDLKECHLQSELSVRLVNAVRALAKEHGWLPWDIRQHTGYLRHLVIRQGERTGETMVNLVTNGHLPERMALLEARLKRDFPEVTTLVNTINTGKAQTAYGEAMHTLFGPGVIHDAIGPYRFEIAPNAFFQTNTRQAERLYEIARDFAEIGPDDLVYDLFCGAGTISLFVAGLARHVVGVELVEEAVENAKANARANGVENVTFVQGDMLALFNDDFVAEHGRPDVLITDPPRAGMHPKVVERIAALRPPRIVYVSCNPQTQALDLARLADAYTIEAVQPVDLFPHTHHIENVVQLRLNEPVAG
ncbi:MAG: 23S rRNA (uracil(1939)-C(5))-methyltransferase RlmD [Rhodothermales bacterium]|nr:23S rRNA (uracil(1939)-C(5))-methyltransferase RlmD [Rhodothermales bacterium]